MFAKKILKDISSERGISILIVFFVMIIILAVVLGINVIILSEMKVIRGMGYSVIAFYAGDTGLEKSLYYDRKIIPTDGTRGICDICISCSDCNSCARNGNDCDSTTCTDCQITYTSPLGESNNKSFQVTATISTLADTFQAYGKYMDVSRAVELSEEKSQFSCGGYFSGGYCWYAGNLGQSCFEVCEGKGGIADSEDPDFGCVWTDNDCTALQYLLPSITCSYCYSECPNYYVDFFSQCFSCEDKTNYEGDCSLSAPETILICACKK